MKKIKLSCFVRSENFNDAKSLIIGKGFDIGDIQNEPKEGVVDFDPVINIYFESVEEANVASDILKTNDIAGGIAFCRVENI